MVSLEVIKNTEKNKDEETNEIIITSITGFFSRGLYNRQSWWGV